MDEFGILTQSFGLKPQVKSAPMAASKRTRNFFAPDSALPNSNFSSNSSRSANDHDGKPPNLNDLDDYDDLYGGPIKFSQPLDGCGGGSVSDYGSIFGGQYDSGSSLPVYDDGLFDSVPGLKSSAASVKHDDFFASMASPPKSTPQFHDLLGNLDEMDLQSNASNRKTSSVEEEACFDDLIPGFGGSTDVNNGSKTAPDTVKSSVSLSIDELEDFAMGKVRNSAIEHHETGEVDIENLRETEKKGREWRRPKESKTAREHVAAAQEDQHRDSNDLESFFSMDAQTSSAPRARATASEMEAAGEGAPSAQEKPQVDGNDSESLFGIDAETNSVPRPKSSASDLVFDKLFKNRWPEGTQSSYAGASSNTRTDSSSKNFVDDLSFMFGVGASIGEFQEFEGENEERRGARRKRHQETKERMAKAVADMNRRDFQTQQEQDERHRIAETVNNEMKQWVAGKEGNLRALLSTLQRVLWPECGWQPVSLTDLITSASVKKVFKKATLCVHPDKVQQKGANTRQKYIAEKVFDLLKEAWNKFNSEELR